MHNDSERSTRTTSLNGNSGRGSTPGSLAATDDDLLELYGINGAVKRRYPELLPTFDVALSVVGSMALAERKRPLSVILEGGSGDGKSDTIASLYPVSRYSDMSDFVYRSDSWTSKSFVTHSSNMKRGQLGKADLLPKLNNKVLLTKELASLFRGHEHDLINNFKTLISVLDGEGLTSDSGTQGRRGYEGRTIFNWIGGTTPLPDATWRLMSQLGNRLLFWEVPHVQPKQGRLADYIKQGHSAVDQHEIRQLVNTFVECFFSGSPIGSIPPESIHFPERLVDELAQWATLLAASRAVVKYQKIGTVWTPIDASPPEGPWRVTDYLKELLLGHCIIHGRDIVDDSDMAIVQHVAFSSCPRHLRPLLRKLSSTCVVNTAEAMTLAGVTHPTARNYLKELALLGIGELTKGNAASNWPDLVTLADDYLWLYRPTEP